MDFNEYQVLARRTQNHELNASERLNHALHGLSSEIGEIHGLYQKVYQGHKLDEKEVIKEMGDVLWFLSELSDCLCVHLGSVASANIEKLMERYPVGEGFSKERSINRKEYAADAASGS